MSSKTNQISQQNLQVNDSKTSQNSTSNSFSPENVKFNLVIDEISRGKEYLKLLEQRQSALKTEFSYTEQNDKTKSSPSKQKDKENSGKSAIKVESNSGGVEKVETEPIELYKQLYPDVYVERIVVPDYIPNYDECPRVNRNIINRDTLSMKQHMNLLAQPKLVKQRQVEEPYVVRKIVPGPSPRIIQLARPKKRQALETCKQFGAKMDNFCIENCHRNIQDVTFVPVHDAVYFIELNKRRPLIEEEKFKLRMKRLQEKIDEAKMAKTHEVLQSLYSSLKNYLLPPPLPEESKESEFDEWAKGTTTNERNTKNATIDQETLKLSKVVRSKMEKLLDCEDQVEQGSYYHLLLVHITEKLAVWMLNLRENKAIEEGFDEVTTEVTEIITEVRTEVTVVTQQADDAKLN